MKHEEIRDALYALFDGELSGEMRLEVESHIKTCGECRQIYQNWQKAAKTLFCPPQIQTSETFVAQVMRKLDELEEPEPSVAGFARKWWGWVTPAFGFGVAAAIFLLVLIPGRNTEITAETLLLANGRDHTVTQYTETDDVVSYVMEEMQ